MPHIMNDTLTSPAVEEIPWKQAYDANYIAATAELVSLALSSTASETGHVLD